MRAIDMVRQGMKDGLRSIVVPEWGGLELFFTKLTIADQEAVEAREPKSAYDKQLMMLVHKACDKDGAVLFQMGDAHELRMNADFMIIQRVVAFMYRTAFSLPDSPRTVDAAVDQLKDGEAGKTVSDSGSV